MNSAGWAMLFVNITAGNAVAAEGFVALVVGSHHWVHTFGDVSGGGLRFETH